MSQKSHEEQVLELFRLLMELRGLDGGAYRELVDEAEAAAKRSMERAGNAEREKDAV